MAGTRRRSRQDSPESNFSKIPQTCIDNNTSAIYYIRFFISPNIISLYFTPSPPIQPPTPTLTIPQLQSPPPTIPTLPDIRFES